MNCIHKGGSCSFAPASDVIILHDRVQASLPKFWGKKPQKPHQGDYNEPPKRLLQIQNRDMYQ